MNRLYKARKRAGMNQTALAVMVGIQPGLLCRYEKGVKPNKKTARKLSRGLNLPVRTIFPDYDTFRNY